MYDNSLPAFLKYQYAEFCNNIIIKLLQGAEALLPVALTCFDTTCTGWDQSQNQGLNRQVWLPINNTYNTGMRLLFVSQSTFYDSRVPYHANWRKNTVEDLRK